MIPFVLFSMRRAWQGFWRNALMSLAATLTMVLMLVLLAGLLHPPERPAGQPLVRGAEGRGRRLRRADRDRRPGADAHREHGGDARGRVGGVRLARQALERFKATQAAQGREDLTQYLESNPLYASINVKLTRPTELRRRSTDALDEDPIVAQRAQHHGAREPGADGHRLRAYGGRRDGRGSSA